MRLKNVLVDLIPALIVVSFVVHWINPNLGRWVGDYKPAAAPMVLTHAERVADVVVFSGTSARLWPQCSPKRVEWFLGVRGGKTVPVVVNWGKPIDRIDGTFAFDGWIAEMDDVDAFKFSTFSNVLHRCRLFAKYDKATGKWLGGWEIPFDIVTRFYR